MRLCVCNTHVNFIINIKYEDLISNTKTEIQNLLNNCDLNWNNDCLNFYNNKRPIPTEINAPIKYFLLL